MASTGIQNFTKLANYTEVSYNTSIQDMWTHLYCRDIPTGQQCPPEIVPHSDIIL